jgi:hypothetical protein
MTLREELQVEIKAALLDTPLGERVFRTDELVEMSERELFQFSFKSFTALRDAIYRLADEIDALKPTPGI